MGKLAIKQIRSAVGRKYDQHRTLAALGINKVNDVVIHQETPQIRGMIKKISHLLEVSEIE
jgi:large subunit ribosomal protein L30